MKFDHFRCSNIYLFKCLVSSSSQDNHRIQHRTPNPFGLAVAITVRIHISSAADSVEQPLINNNETLEKYFPAQFRRDLAFWYGCVAKMKWYNFRVIDVYMKIEFWSMAALRSNIYLYSRYTPAKMITIILSVIFVDFFALSLPLLPVVIIIVGTYVVILVRCSIF